MRRFGRPTVLWGVFGVLLGMMLACHLPQPTPTSPGAADLALTQTALAGLLTQVAAGPSPTVATAAPTATQPPGATPTWTWTPSPTVIHVLTPGSPTSTKAWVADTVCGPTAHQGQPNQPPAGDEYHWNLYERPFNAQTQDTYFPELDIVRANITTDGTWLYVIIELYGAALDANRPLPAYGLELDLDVDGRGEWLVWARGPYQATWSTVGVQVYRDADQDVGEERACRDDPPQEGTSYETLVFDGGQGEDPDLAWVRLLPGEKPQVQLALKYEAIDRDPAFMWWVWADRGVNHPDWMDYHDHFTLAEAGEPFPGRAHYPIQAIAQVDNTCHWVFGFVPDGHEPCICPGEYATPTPTKTLTPTLTPTTASRPGYLSGHLFKDRNGNGAYDAGEGLGGYTVEAHTGSCGGPLIATTVSGGDGQYTFHLGPGTYCLRPQTAVTWVPANRTVTLNSGQTIGGLDFRYPAP